MAKLQWLISVGSRRTKKKGWEVSETEQAEGWEISEATRLRGFKFWAEVRSQGHVTVEPVRNSVRGLREIGRGLESENCPAGKLKR